MAADVIKQIRRRTRRDLRLFVLDLVEEADYAQDHSFS